MLSWTHIYIFCAIMATAFSLFMTPICQKLSEIIKLYDMPKEQAHKLHKESTPLLGGLAIFTAWSATIGIGYYASQLIDPLLFPNSMAVYLNNIPKVSGEIFFLWLGALCALFLGFYDDRYNMPAKTKLCGQFAIAALAVWYGGAEISLFLGSGIATWIISILWLVFIMNAVNVFDNMDGLVAGTATIAFGLFAVTAGLNEEYFMASLGAAASGATLGFWFFNHSPAQIFMGDSGSHFLGYLLAVMATKVTYYTSGTSTSFFPVLIPIFILAVPILDFIAVIIIRLYQKEPIYIGDHNHISHRFVNMGMSRRAAVLCVHILVFVIGIGVVPMMWGQVKTTIIILIQSAALLGLISCAQFSVLKKGEEQDEKKITEDNNE